MLEVTILGCGGSAGVPQIGGPDGHGDWGACDPAEPRNRRSRTSIVLHAPGGVTVLVDTGPDLRTQLLACGIPRVDALVYTHAHADHVVGLDEVRILNRIANRPIEAFATDATMKELVQRFDYAFKPGTPAFFYRPVVVPRLIEPGQDIAPAGVPIRTFDQDHGVMRTLGLRCGGFGYSTDVVGLDDAAFAALAGVDTWLVGCFQRRAHRTHAHLDVVINWASRVGARRTVLTHMGPDLDWSWLVKRLPAGIEPGFDGQRLMISD